MLCWVHLSALFLFVAADSSNTPAKRSQNDAGRDATAPGRLMQGVKGFFDSSMGSSSPFGPSSPFGSSPSAGPSTPFGSSSPFGPSSPFGSSSPSGPSSPFAPSSSSFGSSSSSFGSLASGPGQQTLTGYNQPRYGDFGKGYIGSLGNFAPLFSGHVSSVPTGYGYEVPNSRQMSSVLGYPYLQEYGTSQLSSFPAIQRPMSSLGSISSPISSFPSSTFDSQSNLGGGMFVSQGTMVPSYGSRSTGDSSVQFLQTSSLPDLTSARAYISPATYYPTFQGNPFAPPTFFGPSTTPASSSNVPNQFQVPQVGQQFTYPNSQPSAPMIPNLQQSLPNLQQSLPNLQQLIPNMAQIAPLIQQMANSQAQQSNNRQPANAPQGYPSQGPVYQGQYSLPPTTTKKEHR